MTDTKEPVQNVYTALAAARLEFEPIQKKRENPHFRVKYADLDAILAAVMKSLSYHGLCLTQQLEPEDGGLILKTELMHGATGTAIASVDYITHNPNRQRFGADLTYARRQNVSSLLCLSTEDDDDGNEASKTPQKAPQKPSQPRQAPKDERPAADSQESERPSMAGKSAPELVWYDETGLEHREKSEADVVRGLTACAKAMREELGDGFEDNADWQEWITHNRGPIGHIVANAPDRIASFWRKTADGIINLEENTND